MMDILSLILQMFQYIQIAVEGNVQVYIFCPECNEKYEILCFNINSCLSTRWPQIMKKRLLFLKASLIKYIYWFNDDFFLILLQLSSKCNWSIVRMIMGKWKLIRTLCLANVLWANMLLFFWMEIYSIQHEWLFSIHIVLGDLYYQFMPFILFSCTYEL